MLETYVIIALALPALSVVECGLADTAVCRGDADCGWNSYCDHGQCWCKSGYQRATGSTHCLDRSCAVANCVQCLDDKLCRKCANFLLAGTGRCIDTCNTEYTLRVDGEETGRVCQGEVGGLSMVYVSIIIAGISGVLLIILLALAIHYKVKTDKERKLRMKLMAEVHPSEKLEKTQLDGVITEWDNFSYGSTEDEFRLKRLHYYHQVSALRPHMDTFLAMLRDAKIKCRSLGANDSRQLLYRNLIHQLCRVLTVVNDRMAPMSSDGNLLLDWAHRVLHDYKRYQKPPGPTSNGSVGSSWTLPNGFTGHHRMMNGSLPSSRVHRVQHRSPLQPPITETPQPQTSEANREVAEVSAVHLLANLTHAIEV